MADSDKNILITPNTGSTTDSPKIEFTGGDNNTVTLTTLDDGTLSFSGTSGQLFSISDSLTGTIFSVNDVSGIPSIEVDDDGTIRLAEFGGNLLIGTDVASQYDYKVQVDGNIEVRGDSSPYIRFTEGTTEKAYIQWSSLGFLQLGNDEDGSRLRLKDDLEFTQNGSTWHSVFHEGYHPNADKWTTARTLSLTGDVTGSVSWDGSANASITTTVANDSHSHSNYLPLTGGTLTGHVYLNDSGDSLIQKLDSTSNYGSAIKWYKGGSSQTTYDPQIGHHNTGGDGTGSITILPYGTTANPWGGTVGLYIANNSFKYKNNTIWHAGNDGSGSGLDADLLDGQHASAFASSSHNHSLTLNGDVSGSGSVSGTISVTVNNDSHYHSQVYIPDTRGAARAPSYYPDRYTSFDFQNTSDTGAGGDSWHVLQTVSPWSSYNNSHRQQQIAFTGTGGLKFRYATSDSAWASWQTLWTSGNDGSGSGLDADTVDGKHASEFANASHSHTLTLNGDVSGSGSVSGTITVTVNDNSHNHTSVPSISSTSPGSSYDNSLQYWQTSGQGTAYAPTTDWYNTIRGAHGNANTYYSNTLAMKMTGSYVGDIYTQTRSNGTLQGWNRFWHSNNDGSGSGLDADLLDGNHASAFVLKTGGTISGTLTLQTTNDAQLYLNGNGSTWAGIAWTDVDSTDYMWYRGATGTFAIGGGGSSVSGKKLHIDGGTTIGANLDGTIAPSNGLKVEGEIHDNQGGVFSSYTHSGSDFVDGTLVQTDIPATSASGASYVLEVTGKSYSSSPPFSFIAQGYLYNSTIINHSGVNLSGHGPSYIKAMEYNGNLCFWWPRISYWNSFEVRVRDAGGSSVNRVTSIGNATEPSATKKVQTNLVKTWNSGNDGSGSGLDADLLDGNDASAFAPASHSHSYLPLSGGTVTGNLNVNGQIVVGNGQNSSYILMQDLNEGGRFIHCNSHRIGFLNNSNSWGSWCDDSGNWLSAGNVTAYASDERLKTNITTIANAVDKVKALKGVEYDWKDECESLGFIPTMKHETGVIAQNVQEVIPDAVMPAPFNEEYLTVDKEKIIPVLIEAIKEQQTQLNELQAQIKSLKEK